ncbi:hypothetical protein N658DRAFT_8017 [Parathielavia hyrcaniae]|uniref:Uncharacterized protein n=1 Tax=Parathielavia hyrcaniae TaxID=113614 RepID=A0AAN6Q9M1_9PEZI|nr:hypothetical protein N658DRAFT_8017 [Parathielavia hyrcaniae]
MPHMSHMLTNGTRLPHFCPACRRLGRARTVKDSTSNSSTAPLRTRFLGAPPCRPHLPLVNLLDRFPAFVVLGIGSVYGFPGHSARTSPENARMDVSGRPFRSPCGYVGAWGCSMFMPTLALRPLSMA